MLKINTLTNFIYQVKLVILDYCKMEKYEAKIILSIVIGFVTGALYITAFGNNPIMPGLYYTLESYDFPFDWVLFPIPFFPIISGIVGTLFLEATKKEGKEK